MTDVPSRPRSAALDEKLASLRASYRRALPEQLDALAVLLEAAEGAQTAARADEAWRLAHRVKGTCSSYGFSELATQLERIETLLERAQRTRSPATAEERTLAVAALGRARAALA